MKVAIYTRVSTTEQAREGLSLAEQENRCRAQAQALGHNHVQVFSDPGYSGKDFNRPGIIALMESAPDTVIVYKIDRISRNLREFLNFAQKFNVISVTESFDTAKPAGRVVMNVLASFAEYERDIGAERTAMALRSVARRGWHMGRIPLGYVKAEGKGQLRIDPADAEIIRDLFNHYARQNYSDAAICKHLEGLGIEPRYTSRKSWHHQTVRRMLTNPLYRGVLKWGDIEVPAPELQIVGTDLWDEAQATRLERRTWDPKLIHAKSKGHLLKGLIYCHDRPMFNEKQPHTYADGSVIYYKFYRCQMTRKYYVTKRIDPLVIDAVCDIYLKRSALERAKREAIKVLSTTADESESERGRISKDIASHTKRIENLHRAIELNPALAVEFGERIIKHREIAEALRGSLAKLNIQKDKEALDIIASTRICHIKGDLRNEAIGIEIRRRMLADFISRIELDEADRTITIHPTLPGMPVITRNIDK